MRTRSNAKKSFGQNFIIDQNYIDKIIRALNPDKMETIVEIGAGRGALTERLLESGANVIAIELDRDLIPFLRERFSGYKNFELVESDALKIDFKEKLKDQRPKTKDQQTKLVANLPFNISTAILQRLIAQRVAFSEMILMFQREVVERMIAGPGNSERGFLSVLVEAYLETEKLFDVPPEAFRPVPKVWSAVVRLIPKESIGIENDDLFRAMLSAGFAQRRKTIANNLKNAAENLKIENVEKLLDVCEIDSKRRAETLTLEEWKRLVQTLVAKSA